jgi:hypothetical protein
MLFDAITTLILFAVFSRLRRRRRADVLYYVSGTNMYRRNPAGPGTSPRGAVRSTRLVSSTRPARKRLSFAGMP